MERIPAVLLRRGLTLGITNIALLAILAVSLGPESPEEPGPSDVLCTSCEPDPMSPTGASQFCPHIPGFVQCLLGEIGPEPVEGDNDNDGIPDSDEDTLLLKFAPKIWLHHQENRGPVNVNWLLARTTMRYSHVRCNDHQIISFGSVNSLNSTQQIHRNTKDPLWSAPWNACDHYGPDNHSNSYTASPQKSFFLQQFDSSHGGLATTRDWELYGHVYAVGSNQIVVQYWQLYAFNDSFASSNHEGDWEYTAVLIDEEETPIRVVFYRHGRAEDYAPSDVEWEGNHHVTYVSKGGHGQYRSFVQNFECLGDSYWDDIQGFADKCSPGIAWNSWESEFGGVVNVGEKFRPLNESYWLRYSGRWGEIGFAGGIIDFTSGPQGPAYQPGRWAWGVD